MTSKTATNQNGHMITVIGENVNEYPFLNKLGIIKSRTETIPEVGFKRNAVEFTFDHNVYAVKLNDKVVYRPCMEGTKRYRTF